MNEFVLSPELAEVERRIAERTRPQPGVALRQRVLSALRTERVTGNSHFLWRIAAPLAAVVLLSLNLALSLANHRTDPTTKPLPEQDIEIAVGKMRHDHPQLSEREAYQLVLLARAAPALAAAPALPASLDKIIPWEGEKPWDTR
jgi:hypothetical protein